MNNMTNINRNGVDIIIPVYNALNYLKDCYESIIKYTDLERDHLIILDDCSPDTEVWPWIQSIDHSGITIIRNDYNLGFSETINKGLRLSNRDVILLNSDTIVTSHWIDKIVKCAYSNNSIATVTPFSNSATICSVPVFCKDNQIPYGYSIDEYAQIIENVSQKKYPEMTIAVGFCMFIKRTVIDEVGFFDAETFQRGYGEENDFCWRASQLGYTHRLCDDTFVYHQGTASFISEEKAALISEHSRIVAERYPILYKENEIFVSQDKNSDLREAINLFSAYLNKEKSILYILHMDYHDKTNHQKGGTELHVSDLEKGVADEYNVIVAARYFNELVITITASEKLFQIKLGIDCMSNYFSFRNQSIREIWENLLDAFGVSIVHVHHLKGLSLDIFDVCKEKEIPLIVSLHDYYTVCPTITLVNHETKLCVSKATNEMCKKCLYDKCNIFGIDNYIQLWRNNWENALKSADKLITPSKAARDIIVSYYPDLKNSIQVITHGTEDLTNRTKDITEKTNILPNYYCQIDVLEKKKNGWLIRCVLQNFLLINEDISFRITDRDNNSYPVSALLEWKTIEHSSYLARLPVRHLQTGNSTVEIVNSNANERVVIAKKSLYIDGEGISINTGLNIATIGAITKEKGSDLLLDAVKESDHNVHWFVFGNTNSEALMNNDCIYFAGAYEKSHLGDLLDAYRIDIVCIPSICAETFSYVLSEAWDAKLPVIGSEIGAIGERIRETGAGWTLEKEATGKDLAILIRNLLTNQDEILQKKEAIKHINRKSNREMIEDYKKLYSLYAEKRVCDRSKWVVFAEEISNNMKESREVENQRISDLSKILSEREKELQIIKATKGYRALAWGRHIYLHVRGKE